MEPAAEYKLCKRGHVRSPENLDKHGNCKECKKLWSLKNYTKRPLKTHCIHGHPRTAENIHRSSGACIKCMAEKKWRKNNPGREAASKKLLRARNPNRTKSENRKYRILYQTQRSISNRNWVIKNRNKVNAYRNLETQTISDRYVANNLLKARLSEVTPEMIELQREKIQLIRFIRKAKTAKEKINVNISCNA